MEKRGEQLPIITHSKKQHGCLFPTLPAYTGKSHKQILSLGWKAGSYTLQTQVRSLRLHLIKAGQRLLELALGATE